MSSRAKNEVKRLDERCFELVFVGDQSEETVSETLIRIDAAIDGSGLPRHELCHLVDITLLGRTTSGARLLAAQALSDRDFVKISVFGSGVFSKYLIAFLSSAANRSNKVRYFSNRDEALQWIDSQ